MVISPPCSPAMQPPSAALGIDRGLGGGAESAEQISEASLLNSRKSGRTHSLVLCSRQTPEVNLSRVRQFLQG